MKTLTTKLALAAVGVAMLAAPALAQRQYHPQTQYQSSYGDVGTYPNGAPKTGSAAAQDSGADFNVQR